MLQLGRIVRASMGVLFLATSLLGIVAEEDGKNNLLEIIMEKLKLKLFSEIIFKIILGKHDWQATLSVRSQYMKRQRSGC